MPAINSDLPGSSAVKNLSVWNAGTSRDAGSIPGLGEFTGGGHGFLYASIPAWKIPWTEKHGLLQSIGLQTAGHTEVA